MGTEEAALEMLGGHAVVECIRREGIRHIFHVPGESYLAVLDGLYEAPEITLITNRQEGGACFMAEAYAKATRSVGVCFVTRGPGATNASIGIHCAQQDSTPLVLFVGQIPRRMKGREAFQEVDYTQFFGSMAKWVVEIDDPAKIPDLVPRAFHMARSGRPGPVVVSLPEDVLSAKGSFLFSTPARMTPPHPAPEAVQELVQRVKAAKRPVLLAGGGTQYAHAREALVAFAERFQVPVCTAWRRLDAFPNFHPNYIGALGRGKSPVQDAVQESDLLLVVGHRLSDPSTKGYSLLPKGLPIIQVDSGAEVIGRNYSPVLGLVADARHTLEAALEHPAAEADPTRGAWMERYHQAFQAFSEPIERPSGMVSMEKAMRDMRDVLPADAVITVDAGNASGWVQRYLLRDVEESFLGPTVGSMGYGLPAAIAAKLAHPERVVVGTCGDGSMMMTLQELATAVQHGVNVVQIVFNNGAYGTIRMNQEQAFPGRVIGSKMVNPDFAALAESFGARGLKVETSEEFRPMLEEALAARRPAVMDVRTDVEIISVATTLEEIRGGKG